MTSGEYQGTFGIRHVFQSRAFPSHGRGRRFNPYSAHHKTLENTALFAECAFALATVRDATKHEHDRSIRGKSGDFVPGLTHSLYVTSFDRGFRVRRRQAGARVLAPRSISFGVALWVRRSREHVGITPLTPDPRSRRACVAGNLRPAFAEPASFRCSP